MNRLILLGGGVAASALAAAGIAGAHGTSHATASAARSTPDHARVAVRSSSLGRHLVDPRGHTLYVFMRDRPNHGSTCKGACAAAWPPLRSRDSARAARGVSSRHVSRVRRSDGARQVTYFGRPLYDFSGDSGRNQTNGQGLTEFGGRWYIVSPTGRPITKTASSSNPPPNQPKGVPPTY